jgi:hypothetical protein
MNQQNSYSYEVSNLQRDENDIIVGASFTITVSDGVDSFTCNGYTAFNNKPKSPIKFEDLTPLKVIGWIQESVGKSCEESADAELLAYKERKEIKSGVPW